MVNEKYNIYAYLNNEWVKINEDIDSYTKSETDTLIAAKADANGVYTKTEINQLLANKADTATTYTKTEVDALVEGAFDENSYYTKTSIDSLLANKADSSTVSTLSTQVNTNTSDISTIQSTLSNKADTATTYTKTEVDNAITTAFTNADIYRVVNELPTENIASNKFYLVPNTKNASQNRYDIYIRVSNDWEKVDSIELDISQFASASDMSTAQSNIESLQTTVSNKANSNDVYTKTQTDNLLTNKADTSTTYTKTETDNLLNNKANTSTTYSKTETDTAISTAITNHGAVIQVNQLPATGDVSKIYMVPVSASNND